MLTNKPVLDWTPTPTTGSCAFLDRKLPAEIADCITSIKEEKGVHGRERELLMVESGVAYISEGAAPVNVTWKCDQRRGQTRDAMASAGQQLQGVQIRAFPLPPLSARRPPRLDTHQTGLISPTQPALFYFLSIASHPLIGIVISRSLLRLPPRCRRRPIPSPIPSPRRSHFSSRSKLSGGRALLDAFPAWSGLRGFVSTTKPQP